MARFLVESPHTAAQCLQALDDVSAQGPDTLAKYDWGCAVGDHRGWAIMEGSSESEVRKMIPSSVRDKAKIVKVNKFTAKEIASFHKAK
jgi:hypothetical protein